MGTAHAYPPITSGKASLGRQSSEAPLAWTMSKSTGGPITERRSVVACCRLRVLALARRRCYSQQSTHFLAPSPLPTLTGRSPSGALREIQGVGNARAGRLRRVGRSEEKLWGKVLELGVYTVGDGQKFFWPEFSGRLFRTRIFCQIVPIVKSPRLNGWLMSLGVNPSPENRISIHRRSFPWPPG